MSSLPSDVRLALTLRDRLAEAYPGVSFSTATIVAAAPQGFQATLQVTWHEAPSPESLAEKFLRVLAGSTRPIKGATVARRAGMKYSGHAKRVLAELVEEGEVTLLEEGYWLAGRGASEVA